MKKLSALLVFSGLALASSASAQTPIVLGNAAPGIDTGTPGSQQGIGVDIIDTDTTLLATEFYDLADQIYVTDGATLTIQAGTVIASTSTVDGAGAIAITRGSRIIAQGTDTDPIIFTTNNDLATWSVDGTHPTGRDPKTGTWRPAANEWGNVTIMGNGLISKSINLAPGSPEDTNTATPTGTNVARMEGLVPQSAGDTNVLYGGNDDDDNSGTLEYVVFRYGGRVVSATNELNGLSLGGVGRATTINNVEIMNNIDDGIEIWGGTVEVKNASIWNIGDDSFDVDQGWRGKAQNILVVQGYSDDSGAASQGSGVGDNMFEVDGAEDSDAQPVTTASVYNFTLIGQPLSGDGATAWRDGARVQYRNGIIMNTGEETVRNDGDDGDGASGYGFNGTLPFYDASNPDIWDTAYTATSAVNAGTFTPGAFNDPAVMYTAQSAGDSSIGQGFLAEITDTVFYQNNTGDSGEQAVTVGVLGAGYTSNAAKGNVVATNSPIQAITRDSSVAIGSLNMLRVLSLDPTPANDALTSEAAAPADGFFTPQNYRGAFAPGNNWLLGWSASDAYGFLQAPVASVDAWHVF